MLEALVSLRRTAGEGAIGGAERTERKVGDVVCVKKSPAVWGRDERRFFLIAKLRDDGLEASMTGGGMTYPYAVHDEVEAPLGQTMRDLVNRSKYRVVIGMFEGSPGLDPEDDTSEPVSPNGKECLELSDLILDEAFRI